ncbi:phosphohistidine phosphatase SixA [Alteromonas halophila]|uniref:Phosphohistidine phosphatase SixA n=1 Tax=Alteromonas halophila TaxID=516698 RepID=A0A918JCF7_9ALTE|nr:phosphohistidine phosphatase SixA [Alteromonas halophila]
MLFIMRHGEAEPPRFDDKSRQLTDNGRKQVTLAAQWLIDTYCDNRTIDLALVSPYRRTRQSFDMLSLDIAFNAMEISEDITPDGDPELVSDYLAARISSAQAKGKPIQRLMLVSHMPLVSYLVDTLSDAYTTSLFATASVAVIRYSVADGKGSLQAHYQGR